GHHLPGHERDREEKVQHADPVRAAHRHRPEYAEIDALPCEEEIDDVERASDDQDPASRGHLRPVEPTRLRHAGFFLGSPRRSRLLEPGLSNTEPSTESNAYGTCLSGAPCGKDRRPT